MATGNKSTLITTLPLTAEAREKFLAELFQDELPHMGELFVPGNSFYIHGSSHARALHMLGNLCEWLGIKPGYIGVEFESHPEADLPGHRHTIFIESSVARNEMLLGATLAHALTRYLFEERKQIRVADTYEQLSVLATATIVFGLGVVVANGLEPGQRYTAVRGELLGDVPPREYGAMLLGFLWQRAIPEHAYINSLAPWTSKLLGVTPSKRPINAVRQLVHAQRQKKYQTIGLWWVSFIVLMIVVYLVAHMRGLHNPQAAQLKEKVRLHEKLVSTCKSSLAYTTQYSDLSDIQTQRAVNAEELRCKSLENQLESAQNAYEAML